MVRVLGSDDFVLDFGEVVSKLVVCNHECVCFSGILNAVRVIIVLAGCFDKETEFKHLAKERDVVWNFGLFDLVAELSLLDEAVDLVIVKEILWKEADDLVSIFHPVVDGYVQALSRKHLVPAMLHRHILCIQHNKWLE